VYAGDESVVETRFLSQEESCGTMLTEEIVSISTRRSGLSEKSFFASIKVKEKFRLKSISWNSDDTFPVRQTRSRLSEAVDLLSIPGVVEHITRRKKQPPPPEPPTPDIVVLPNPPSLTPSILRITRRLNAEIDRILAARA
jgi:hypothetical protein